MKNIKYFILPTAVFFLLSNCGSFSDIKKQNKSDEFLVEKKSPLVLPPNFSKLPIPSTQNDSDKIKTNKIKDLLNNDETNSPEETSQNKNFEELIIEKIKKD
jgi:hypothetical protein